MCTALRIRAWPMQFQKRRPEPTAASQGGMHHVTARQILPGLAVHIYPQPRRCTMRFSIPPGLRSPQDASVKRSHRSTMPAHSHVASVGWRPSRLLKVHLQPNAIEVVGLAFRHADPGDSLPEAWACVNPLLQHHDLVRGRRKGPPAKAQVGHRSRGQTTVLASLQTLHAISVTHAIAVSGDAV